VYLEVWVRVVEDQGDGGVAPILSIPRHWLFIGAGVIFVLWLIKAGAEKLVARERIQPGKLQEGKVFGVVGKMGYGKTSFAVGHFAIPALKQGRTVVSNFTIRDDDLPGRSVLMRPSSFGSDLLGIGSSLQLDRETGEPASGWFVDTACNCGKQDKAQEACGCNGALVIIDESHLFVPASNSRQLPVELHQWFTMARKNHVEVVWLTQYWKWVHATVRRLSTDIWDCRPTLVRGRHEAYCFNPHDMDDKQRIAHAKVDYSITEALVSRYDTYEIVVPAATAFDIAGQMRKGHMGQGASGAPARSTPGPTPLLPPPLTIPPVRTSTH
jgi:hypothetical protein